jgi:Mn2+/Fe2+ NRAMP family transporter
MALIRERFPRPILWLAVFLVVTANTFNIGADLGSMAAAFRLLVPLPFAAVVIVFAAVTVLLEVLSGTSGTRRSCASWRSRSSRTSSSSL